MSRHGCVVAYGVMERMSANTDSGAEKEPFMDSIYEKARAADATVVLAEAEDQRVKDAAAIIEEMGLAKLILLDGNSFHSLSAEEQHELVETVRTARPKDALSPEAARDLLTNNTKYLAAAMVKAGKADGFVAGNASETAETIRPALKIIGAPRNYASSFFIMLHGDKPLFFADCGFNVDPNPEQLAKIAVDTAENVRALGIEPRVAFLSFSTGASLEHEHITKMRTAIEQTRLLAPELKISEHELQFDAALDPEVAAKKAPNSLVAGTANIFIFPDLNSGNIGYKIAHRIGGARAVGPIFQGFNAPVNDLSRGCSAQDIVDVVAVTAMQAGALKNRNR